jgi:hypothetical protein
MISHCSSPGSSPQAMTGGSCPGIVAYQQPSTSRPIRRQPGNALATSLAIMRLNSSMLVMVGYAGQTGQLIPPWPGCKHDHVPRSPERPGARVERELRERVSGMQPKDQLPPVAVLAAEHHAAKGTVEAALRRLADEGLVEIVPRWGVFKL